MKKLTLATLLLLIPLLGWAQFGGPDIYTAPNLTEIGTSTSGGLGVKWTGNSYFMGKLGIAGITNPSKELEVNGDMKLSGVGRVLIIGVGAAGNYNIKGNAGTGVVEIDNYNTIGKHIAFQANTSGNVIIGAKSTTSKLAINGGRVTIDVDGTFTEGDHHLEISNGATYSELDAGEAQFTTSSSKKIKENIKPVRSKINLAMMDSVKAVEFNFRFDKIVQQFNPKRIAGWDSMTVAQQDSIRLAWIKKEVARAQKEANKKHVGLIAEDFGKILGRENAEKINWNEVTMVMWEAIRDLRQRVAILEKKVATLEQSKK